MEELLKDLVSKFPWLSILLLSAGLLVYVAQTIVYITPGKKDDLRLEEFKKNKIFKKIWDFLLSWAPLQKEGGKLKLSKK